MKVKRKTVANVPNLRFPGFEGEWKQSLFGDLCKISTGNKNTQDKSYDGQFPFYVRSSTVERINEFTFDGEAILTAGDGVGVGKVFHYTTGKIGVHQRVYILSDFKRVSGKFLYYYFSSRFFDRVSKLSAKNSVDSVRYDMIAKMHIAFPDIDEQNKIANLVSLIDERIQTQSKILLHYKSLIKTLRSRLLKRSMRFKDGLDEYPTWNEKKISEILKIGSGKDYKHLNAGTIPVFGTGGFMISVDDFLHNGETVCIGRKGTIDKPMYFNGKIWTVDTLFYTHSFNFSRPKYIFHLFQTINWFEYNEASGVPSLSKSTIEQIVVEIPTVEEQDVIANFLFKLDSKIEIENSILSRLEKQKKFLLQQIFVK